MLHRGVKYTEWIQGSIVNQSWADFAVTPQKNKRLATDVRELYQCSISLAAVGQQGRREKSPSCCWMVSGEEKDTADKCINYFINFSSQLTLHATFQVSQPGEEEVLWHRQLRINQKNKNLWVREKMRWGKMKNLRDNSFSWSFKKQSQ